MLKFFAIEIEKDKILEYWTISIWNMSKEPQIATMLHVNKSNDISWGSSEKSSTNLETRQILIILIKRLFEEDIEANISSLNGLLFNDWLYWY